MLHAGLAGWMDGQRDEVSDVERREGKMMRSPGRSS